MSLLSDAEARSIAASLLAARAARHTLDPLTDQRSLTLDGAYAIQRAGLALRVERGERRVGWKLGYTSAAMREQMRVDGPNYGPLTDVMAATSGVDVGDRLTHPKVEPEIAVIVGADGAVVRAHACLEVVDSVYTDYRFTLVDNTADGSSAGMFVVGPELPIDDLAAITVEFSVNGEIVATSSGAAADGDPRRGLRWLGEQLAATGQSFAAGDIVLTGGLTRAYPLTSGTTIEARFDGAAVMVSRS